MISLPYDQWVDGLNDDDCGEAQQLLTEIQAHKDGLIVKRYRLKNLKDKGYMALMRQKREQTGNAA